ncbi:hypothetical protein O1D87_003489 [Vibrio cholerae]|uniref:hypothetical protein n=1 Tax=Vibrio cholerae TaxID=666 RepID=UPI000E69DA2C|nr:hypothetical protein [Vibrio cholerae]EGQ9635472.1 hypothetical protein [Vibrio cholerae]EGR3971307.1 hypothetical protein [Vibrio cholerae]EKG0039234.1 hypothetical protein [Vibrio cholerae]ELF6478355.1 hypothetical protein [Vibrio cholerae]ELH8889840.1 hypothetical protein [Vibrio cholerae]
MGKFLVGLLLAIVVAGAQAADTFPEPFGLSWGMSEAGLKKLGFTQVSDANGLRIFSSVSVPKAWSKAENYVAVTYKGRLVKVAAMSTDFTDDIYGSKGKSNYEQVKSLLTKKYGSPSTHYERVGGDLYDDADEFYQCLDYSGCGAYLSIFDYAGGVISVQLKGKRRGEGFLTIGYESPQFLMAKKEIENGDLQSDADAF